MKIDVKKIAKLSNIDINEKEIPVFEKQMQDILSMVEKLPKINSSFTGLDEKTPMTLREDNIRPSFSRDELHKNAPQTQAGCIVVPRIVE